MMTEEANLRQVKRIGKKAMAVSGLPASRQTIAADPAPRDAASGDTPAVISPERRRELIEVAAYYRAERRGFAGASPEQDWLEAEAALDGAAAPGRT